MPQLYPLAFQHDTRHLPRTYEAELQVGEQLCFVCFIHFKCLSPPPAPSNKAQGGKHNYINPKNAAKSQNILVISPIPVYKI